MSEMQRDENGRFVAAQADEPQGETPEVDQDAPQPDPNLEAEAKKYGWRPKEEFTKNPDGWVDASRFLELPSTQNKVLRDQLRDQREMLSRIDATTSAAVQRARDQERSVWEQKIAEIRAEQVEAVQSADVEAFTAARQREEQMLRRAPAPDPAPASPFEAKYKDWSADPEMRQFAATAVQNAPGITSLSPERQWQWADQQVRQVFADRFQQAAPPPLTHSRVDGGGLGLRRPAGKGAMDLPAEARSVAKEFVKQGLFKDEDAYAKAYFAQEGA